MKNYTINEKISIIKSVVEDINYYIISDYMDYEIGEKLQRISSLQEHWLDNNGEKKLVLFDVNLTGENTSKLYEIMNEKNHQEISQEELLNIFEYRKYEFEFVKNNLKNDLKNGLGEDVMRVINVCGRYFAFIINPLKPFPRLMEVVIDNETNLILEEVGLQLSIMILKIVANDIFDNKNKDSTSFTCQISSKMFARVSRFSKIRGSIVVGKLEEKLHVENNSCFEKEVFKCNATIPLLFKDKWELLLGSLSKSNIQIYENEFTNNFSELCNFIERIIDENLKKQK